MLILVTYLFCTLGALCCPLLCVVINSFVVQSHTVLNDVKFICHVMYVQCAITLDEAAQESQAYNVHNLLDMAHWLALAYNMRKTRVTVFTVHLLGGVKNM